MCSHITSFVTASGSSRSISLILNLALDLEEVFRKLHGSVFEFKKLSMFFKKPALDAIT